MVNKVILIGNLGQDPDVKQTNNGTTVANIRLATTERRKDQSGNWADHTEWHTVVAFSHAANAIQKYCHKGKQLFVEGRLQTRKWQDKNGQDRYSTEIVADSVKFIGNRPEGERFDQHKDRQSHVAPKPMIDDFPF